MVDTDRQHGAVRFKRSKALRRLHHRAVTAGAGYFTRRDPQEAIPGVTDMGDVGAGGVQHREGHLCLPAFGALTRRGARSLHGSWTHRLAMPWVARIAVPLSMIAAGLTGLWWSWPLLALCALTASPGEAWGWVLAIEEAVIGTEWAWLGASSFASFPTNRGLVALCWVGFPIVLAVVGWRAHHRPD